MHSSAYISITIWQFIPTLSFPPWCLGICSLCLCLYFCSQIDSSVPFFYIPYTCINIWQLFFSFWFTLLWITVSRSIHTSTNGTISFLHCIYVPRYASLLKFEGHIYAFTFINTLMFYVVQLLSHAPTLWPHELQHARPSCPSPSPGVCPSSCSLYQWYHPAISSSDTHFSICPQSFPTSGTFPMSRLFTSDDQNTGVSASVLPMNIQGLSPLRLTCLISLCSRDFQESSPEPQFEGIILWHSAFLKFQLSQLYMTTGMNVIYYSFKQTQCRLW